MDFGLYGSGVVASLWEPRFRLLSCGPKITNIISDISSDIFQFIGGGLESTDTSPVLSRLPPLRASLAPLLTSCRAASRCLSKYSTEFRRKYLLSLPSGTAKKTKREVQRYPPAATLHVETTTHLFLSWSHENTKRVIPPVTNIRARVIEETLSSKIRKIFTVME